MNDKIVSLVANRKVGKFAKSELLGKDHYDPKEPDSLASLVQETVAKAIEAVPMEVRHLDEETLTEMMQPTLIHRRLRITFWAEYFRAVNSDRKMVTHSIFAGVCSNGLFHRDILPNGGIMAYLMIPPSSYDVTAEECLNFGYSRLREIISLPIRTTRYNKQGEPIGQIVDTKLASLIFQITKGLEDRLHGPVAQRIEQKTIQMSGKLTEQQTARIVEPPETVEQLEKQLEVLRAEDSALSAPDESGPRLQVVEPLPVEDGEIV